MEDKYQWQFVRRFFIIDTIGSLEPAASGESNDNEDVKGGQLPKNIRYLKRLHIRFVPHICQLN